MEQDWRTAWRADNISPVEIVVFVCLFTIYSTALSQHTMFIGIINFLLFGSDVV